jgi:branched-subunit amino acid transport protein AzlD
MPSHWYILSGILTAAAVTWTLRAAPFAMLAPLRSSGLLTYLGERLPVGLMVILAVYTLRDVRLTVLASGGATAVALAVTIGLHLWRRNAIVSIVAGTAASVILQSAPAFLK